MRIAVLVKQVPLAESLALRPDGRLQRDGIELEMNAYCRRAVSKGVELALKAKGTCTVLTLGPPSAEDALREAIAWGADSGIHISDGAFAGSDTLATSRALAAAIRREGPFDLVLVGRNSVDADTGQVPPELAQLLDLPFAAGAREIEVDGSGIVVRCELDDGWRRVRLGLPAVVSTAERLCEPAKAAPNRRLAVPAKKIRRIDAAALGPGPFGAAGSPTSVGRIRVMEVDRRGIVLEGPVAQQAARAVAMLRDWGAVSWEQLTNRGSSALEAHRVVPPRQNIDGPVIAVAVEPRRVRQARELLGEAAQLAEMTGATVVSVGPGQWSRDDLDSWGADGAVQLADVLGEEDVADSISMWAAEIRPWAILAPGTLWGREVAGRVAARLGVGLTGDAVGLAVEDGRLVAWKPAFGGRVVAAITASSQIQMATVRPGVLELRSPRRPSGDLRVDVLDGRPRGRVVVLDADLDDEVEILLAAQVVVGVGAAVAAEDYASLQPLLKVLGAELGATRKVTDKSWLPRSRQIGLTGHSVAPALYVSLGAQGKFNHMIGTCSAKTVLAVNTDARAPVFQWSDIGIVADWREAVVALVAELEKSAPPNDFLLT